MAEARFDIEVRWEPWVEAWRACMFAQWPQWEVRLIWPQTVRFRWRFVGSPIWREGEGKIL